MQISLSDENVISSNGSLAGPGPLSKCNFPLEKGNFYSIFSASPVSAVSQNNLCAKEAYSGGGTVSHPSPAPGPYPDDKMTE